MTALELRNVSKTFRSGRRSPEARALLDVSLDVAEGEFVSILGPSGCGKTTLLKVLAGIVRPDAGGVFCDGRPVTGPSKDRSLVFQDYALFEWKTGVANVAFGLKARGTPKSERAALAGRYLDLVQLASVAHRYPDELSGGMRQRLALARALATEPRCLLFDEPFAALDYQLRQLIHEELALILDAGPKTVVLVTHDVDEAILLSDRVVILSSAPGRVIDSVTIPLQRPRPRHPAEDKAANELRRRIWRCLEPEVHAASAGSIAAVSAS